jgi:hypothetical protein
MTQKFNNWKWKMKREWSLPMSMSHYERSIRYEP